MPPNVELFLGSGTLANDVIAAQLSLDCQDAGLVSEQWRVWQPTDGPGAAVQAAILKPWNLPGARRWISRSVRRKLSHVTASGVVVVRALRDVHRRGQRSGGAEIVVQRIRRQTLPGCISSLGTMPVDLTGVHFASGRQRQRVARRIPAWRWCFIITMSCPPPSSCRAIWISVYYAGQEGIPFTFSSNLLHALHAAVRGVNWERRFAELAETRDVAADEARGNGLSDRWE